MLDVLLSSIALSILYKHAEQTNQRPSNTEAPAELLLVLASCEVSHFYDMQPTKATTTPCIAFPLQLQSAFST